MVFFLIPSAGAAVVNRRSSLAAWAWRSWAALAWRSWEGRELGRAGWGGVLGGTWSDRLGSEVWDFLFFIFF
jgi:hypothetical protein